MQDRSEDKNRFEYRDYRSYQKFFGIPDNSSQKKDNDLVELEDINLLLSNINTRLEKLDLKPMFDGDDQDITYSRITSMYTIVDNKEELLPQEKSISSEEMTQKLKQEIEEAKNRVNNAKKNAQEKFEKYLTEYKELIKEYPYNQKVEEIKKAVEEGEPLPPNVYPKAMVSFMKDFYAFTDKNAFLLVTDGKEPKVKPKLSKEEGNKLIIIRLQRICTALIEDLKKDKSLFGKCLA